MAVESMLFSPLRINGLALKNRIMMTPLYLGYAHPDGTVSPLLLDHYREMAASGAAAIVVEHTAVDPSGLGSPFMLRIDDDRYIQGLSRLARAIQDEGAIAFLQLNHPGRYAYTPQRLAPSPVKTGDVVPKEMTQKDIEQVVRAFAAGAGRVKEAGFDGVEIHGGTGYLIVQFLSPRTNHRTDRYGGPLENRMRFPLEVVDAVVEAVGEDYPVGYRFLADEGLPEGLHPEQTAIFATELENRRIAYLSVMAGIYDAFSLPEYRQREKEEAYMAHFAAEIKKAVSGTPVVTAGRIQSPEIAERILKEGTADLIGLARVLFADPLWPQKAQGVVPGPIVACEPTCSLCMQRTMKGKPAFCSQWDKKRREAFLERVGEGSGGKISGQMAP
ncbi:Flavin oxidoreductase/NADH oxidase NADH [uncultured Desulfatiglans sp.]|nr:Flavin oxidoreductase/NADH oxidase NADH [uncultured Desulfatiglans sp.]